MNMRLPLVIAIVTLSTVSVCDSFAESCALFSMPMPEIHRAACSGDVASVEQLLSAKPELARTSDRAHGTPLHVASANGRDAIVVLLIASGADVNAKNWRGDTPIDFAITGGHEKVVGTLVARGATGRPIHMACALGNTNIVELLLEKGADPDARDNSDYRIAPLHAAARYGRVEVARMLLKRHVDPNVPDKYGHTPLHLAAENGQLEMVKFLIANGAKVNATTIFKDTPLHSAACQKNKAVVEVLVSAGANINAANKDGFTPLKAARTWGAPEIVTFLKEHGGKE